MLFLDANIFYSYFGRPKLGMTSEPIDPNALSHFLDLRTDKSLPTSVLIEIMTHFRESSQFIINIAESNHNWSLSAVCFNISLYKLLYCVSF